jgi:hypothetical protein
VKHIYSTGVIYDHHLRSSKYFYSTGPGITKKAENCWNKKLKNVEIKKGEKWKNKFWHILDLEMRSKQGLTTFGRKTSDRLAGILADWHLAPRHLAQKPFVQIWPKALENFCLFDQSFDQMFDKMSNFLLIKVRQNVRLLESWTVGLFNCSTAQLLNCWNVWQFN